MSEHHFSLLCVFVFLLKELNWEEGEAMAMQHPKAPQCVTYVVHNSEARQRGLWPYFNFCIDSITPPWDCWESSVMHQGEKMTFWQSGKKRDVQFSMTLWQWCITYLKAYLSKSTDILPENYFCRSIITSLHYTTVLWSLYSSWCKLILRITSTPTTLI